jgi:hypothetical protein
MGPTASLPLRSKCALRIFITHKNPPSSVGFEPATVASTLTTRPPGSGDDSYIFCNYGVIYLLQLWSYFSTKSSSFSTHFCQYWVIYCTPVLHNSLPWLRSTLQNFVSICCHLQNGVHTVHPLEAKQMVLRGCQIWAVSRMGKNSPSHFYDCLMCAQAGVRLSIVIKEKDFVFWLGWTLWTCCHSLFKVSLYYLWCAVKSRKGILQHWYTASYSVLVKVCWKWWRLCEK